MWPFRFCTKTSIIRTIAFVFYCPRSVKAIFIVYLLLLRHKIEIGIYSNIINVQKRHQPVIIIIRLMKRLDSLSALVFIYKEETV